MRLRALIDLVRAPAALSVPGDVVAGAAAARVLTARTAGLACCSVCLYWAGMAANDWADRHLDAVERPERPIPSGRITPRAALAVALGLTGAGLVAAGLAGGRRSLAVAAPLAAAVWAYDLRWKNTAAGPAGMAACRALDVLLGASPGRVRSALPAAAVVGVHTWTVTELSRREVTGAPRTLPAATLAITAAVCRAATSPARPRSILDRGASAPILKLRWRRRRHQSSRSGSIGHHESKIAAASVLAAAYALRYGRAQVAVLVDPGAGAVRAAVGAGITSLPALQGALAARAGATRAGLAVAAAAPAAAALARKVSPT